VVSLLPHFDYIPLIIVSAFDLFNGLESDITFEIQIMDMNNKPFLDFEFEWRNIALYYVRSFM